MPRNIRFTTRRLFLVSAGFALAAATFPADRRAERLDWSGFLLSLLSFLAVIGIFQQTADLRQFARERRLGRGERFAVRLSVSWRVALIAALVACYTLELLISRGFVQTELRGADVEPYDRYSYAILFPNFAWSLCVLLMLAALPHALPPRRGEFIFCRTRRVAAWILGFALVVATLGVTTLISHLVHVATAGIEVHQPLQFQRRGTFPEHSREAFAFFWTSCLAMACIGIGVFALAALVRAAQSSSRWLCLALFTLLAALGVMTLYTIWYHNRELPRVSPDVASVNLPLNWVGMVFLTVTVVTAAFIVSLRLVGDGGGDGRILVWHRASGYFHESRATGLLAVALAAYELVFLKDAVGRYIFQDTIDVIRDLVQFASTSRLIQMIGTSFNWPPTYMWIALLWIGLRLLFRHHADPPAEDWSLQPIRPGPFVALFVLTAWLIASGLFTLTAFVFAMWFGPWLR